MRKWRGLAPLEKSVAKDCDVMMRDMGWTVIKLSQRGGSRVRKSHVTAGVPDRRYYREGDSFWFESKQADRGVQSEEQKAFQSMVERAGELYVIGGLKELTAFLKQWGEKVRMRA